MAQQGWEQVKWTMFNGTREEMAQQGWGKNPQSKCGNNVVKAALERKETACKVLLRADDENEKKDIPFIKRKR